jgi:hypothetical protein
MMSSPISCGVDYSFLVLNFGTKFGFLALIGLFLAYLKFSVGSLFLGLDVSFLGDSLDGIFEV